MSETKNLLLIGGGHAHLEVTRVIGSKVPQGWRVTLINDGPSFTYSGMIPGFVAGQYRLDELTIDLPRLCARCGVRFIESTASRIDATTREAFVNEGGALRYDIASIDIGSTLSGLDRPGVREHALAVRPMKNFAHQIAALSEHGPIRNAVVVGGGVAGVELAFCIEARLRHWGVEPHVTLIESGPRIVAGFSEDVAKRLESLAAQRSIRILTDTSLQAVLEDHVELDRGESLPVEVVLWATGAAAPALFRDSGLPMDNDGFLRVSPTLQAWGVDDLFAAGDGVSIEGQPTLPKAGVYAVRQAPVLANNLLARIEGRSLQRFKPQKHALTLMNLGDGTALGTKWGVSLTGRGVRAIKDRIDRKFIDRYRA